MLEERQIEKITMKTNAQTEKLERYFGDEKDGMSLSDFLAQLPDKKRRIEVCKREKERERERKRERERERERERNSEKEINR